jgi:D-arabinose 1-dehydrogenase-like Zn-dependent alcohol dehydrogenase
MESQPIELSTNFCPCAYGPRTRVKAYGAFAGDKPLEPIDIERRQPGPHEVQSDIAYCGVCHSNLHHVRSEWEGTIYPCMPGREIVGHVAAVGGEVTKFRVGDTVGVGCLVDSCQHCASCEEGLEQFCENGKTLTYETQEMLDFCAERGIVAEIEMILVQKIDEAYDRMQKSDVKYRFVIDNAALAA